MTPITLHHAHCLDILPTLDPADIHAVITDPPYGIALTAHGDFVHIGLLGKTIPGDENPDVGQAVLAWAEAHDLPTIAFASPWQPWPGYWRNLLVWDKGPQVGIGGDMATCWRRTWELIQMARNPPYNGDRDVSVLHYPISNLSFRLHPNQKPVDLLAYLITKTTQPGDVILDPFMGSASTGVACLHTGRAFLGIEIDLAYFLVAQHRIERVQAKLARLEVS